MGSVSNPADPRLPSGGLRPESGGDPSGAYLSPHLPLRVACRTDRVAFLDAQARPPPEVVAALRRFAAEVYEPLLSLWGEIVDGSFWRSPGLNRAVGGAPTSAHLFGRAGDMAPRGMGLVEGFELLLENGIAFDKAILERKEFAQGRSATWVHVQVGPRLADGTWAPARRIALMSFGDGRYLPWAPNDARVRALAHARSA